MLLTNGKGYAGLVSAEVTNTQVASRHDRILDIVVELLESQGYDAVQLREVARRARTSLATIYKRYATRDELILAALERWMEENRYAGLAAQPHSSDEPLHDGLMRVLRTIFQPWEGHPDMLKAYFRARAAPGGESLVRRGLDAVVPSAMAVLGNVDADLVKDLDTVLSSLVYGLVGRFAAGEIQITDILPTLERAVFRLTSGYDSTSRA